MKHIFHSAILINYLKSKYYLSALQNGMNIRQSRKIFEIEMQMFTQLIKNKKKKTSKKIALGCNSVLYPSTLFCKGGLADFVNFLLEYVYIEFLSRYLNFCDHATFTTVS